MSPKHFEPRLPHNLVEVRREGLQVRAQPPQVCLVLVDFFVGARPSDELLRCKKGHHAMDFGFDDGEHVAEMIRHFCWIVGCFEDKVGVVNECATISDVPATRSPTQTALFREPRKANTSRAFTERSNKTTRKGGP